MRSSPLSPPWCMSWGRMGGPLLSSAAASPASAPMATRSRPCLPAWPLPSPVPGHSFWQHPGVQTGRWGSKTTARAQFQSQELLHSPKARGNCAHSPALSTGHPAPGGAAGLLGSHPPPQGVVSGVATLPPSSACPRDNHAPPGSATRCKAP